MCPICKISSKYISTHLRRVHKVQNPSDLQQMARYAEKEATGKVEQ
jgi:hypothetical protein